MISISQLDSYIHQMNVRGAQTTVCGQALFFYTFSRLTCLALLAHFTFAFTCPKKSVKITPVKQAIRCL